MADEELERRFEAALTVAGRGRDPGGRLKRKTRLAYAKAWSDAERWVRATSPIRGRAMPWSSETLAQYARHLLEQGYAKSTVDGRLAAVKAKHRERGEPVPDGVAAWFVLRGAHNSETDPAMVNNRRPRRAALAAMAAELDPATASGARDLALVSLGWDLHAQVIELVAIDMDDVTEADDGLTVVCGGRRLLVEHVHEPVDVCPVESVQAWLAHLRRSGARSGALFRAVDKGGNIAGLGGHGGPNPAADRLTASGVQRIWARLRSTGVLPRESTPSDMRLASALDAARGGTPLPDILARAGWSSASRDVMLRLMTAALEGRQRCG